MYKVVSTTTPPTSTQELDSLVRNVPFLDQAQCDAVSVPVYVHVSVTWDPWITAGDTGVNVTV